MKIAVLSRIINLSHELISARTSLLPPVKSSDLIYSFHRCIDDAAVLALKESDIVLADPNLFLDATRDVKSSELKLSWVQCTFAGINSLLNAENRQCYRLTRTGGVLGSLIAEYCISQIIMHERKFDCYKEAQCHSIWLSDVTPYRSLSNLRIGIMGVGDIGSCLVESLRSFGCSNICGFVRKEREASSDHLHFFTSLELFLATECDYIINTLPSTPATVGLLNNSVLSKCAKKPPVLINVGRGDVISEEELIKALEMNWLCGGILDVLPSEPLPKHSPLWRSPSVVITPHIAAKSSASMVAQAFYINLMRYLRGDSLLYEVDWNNGY